MEIKPKLATITWKCTIPGPLKGKELKYGHVKTDEMLGRVVTFAEMRVGGKSVRPVIRLDGTDRDTLPQLAAAYEASLLAQQQWEADRKAALKASWDAEIAKIAEQLPVGCVLAADHGDEWEGNQSYSFTLDGKEHVLHQGDHKIKAAAQFNFAYDGRKVFFVALPEVEVRAALGLVATTETAKQEAAETYRTDLLSMEVPTAAREAYNRYHGDAEKAWEDENEGAWALINRYAEEIEAQGRK